MRGVYTKGEALLQSTILVQISVQNGGDLLSQRKNGKVMEAKKHLQNAQNCNNAQVSLFTVSLTRLQLHIIHENLKFS